MDPQIIDILRAFVVIFGMVIASYYDQKYRYIPDKIWNTMFGLGAVFLSLELIWTTLPEQVLIHASANIFFAVLLGWSLYLRLGWQFGGADVKALTAISLLIPAPLTLNFGWETYWMTANPPFDFILPLPIIAVLTNSAAIGFLYVFRLVIVKTLQDGYDSTQPLISILSRQVSVNELLSYHGFVTDMNIYPMYQSSGAYTDYKTMTNEGIPTQFLMSYVEWYNEEYNENCTNIQDITEWKLHEFLASSEDFELDTESELGTSTEEIVASLESLQEQESVYVTPGFPLIVFLTVGVLLTVFVGDIFTLLFPF
jgi:hypothetical protein